MLDVRRMRVLREVAQRGSFSAAAEALSFTQSAVSQQIAALEREAGAVLVERSARGVRLTDAGEAVVRHAEQILARLAEAEAELEAIAGLRGGRLRMAAFESAAATIMPVAIAAFANAHPAVELSMTLLDPEASVAALKAGDIDIAITFGAGEQEDRFGDGVEHHHLLEDPMYLVLPQDHPLARKRGVRLADLAGEPWIGGAPDCECNRLISQACLRFGFDPRIAFETDDYAAVQGFVAAGVGVSLIAELGLRTARDDIVIRPLGRDTPVRQIYATALTGYRSPATVAMIELLREVGAEHAARRPRLELVSG
jgi:molybdate transport repressor ModE-like protein